MADALTDQITDELRQIEASVSTLLNLESQWSGVVELIELSLEANGKKRFDCSIEISRAAALKESRWRVLIHEMIHAHSVGLTREAYERYRGWEEGVVEHLQRQLRSEILRQLSVEVEHEVFAAEEATFSFVSYVEEMDSLRIALNMPALSAQAFYRELLSKPLPLRAMAVADLLMSLPQDKQKMGKQRLLTAHRRLCRPF